MTHSLKSIFINCLSSVVVDEGSTQLIYYGRVIPVIAQQLHSTKMLGEGAFGKVSTVVIDGPPEICMAVKVRYLLREKT